MNIVPRDSIFDFDRFFNHFGLPAVQKELDDSFFSPRVDITDRDDSYVIKAELAGVDKDNLSVTLEDGLLTIQASVETEKTDEEKGRVIRKERRTGSYLRSFNVGKNLHDADISAKFENGLLELTIPKVGEAKKISRKIEVN
jgi:HSP20 family protein